MFSYSRMRPRKDHREVGIKGAFPGADVVRGKDWNLEDKDGEHVFYDCQICSCRAQSSFLCILMQEEKVDRERLSFFQM